MKRFLFFALVSTAVAPAFAAEQKPTSLPPWAWAQEGKAAPPSNWTFRIDECGNPGCRLWVFAGKSHHGRLAFGPMRRTATATFADTPGCTLELAVKGDSRDIDVARKGGCDAVPFPFQPRLELERGAQPSFSCGPELSDIENVICQGTLRDADRRLAESYRKLSQMAGSRKNELKALQKTWVAERDRECSAVKEDFLAQPRQDCLDRYYSARLALFETWRESCAKKKCDFRASFCPEPPTVAGPELPVKRWTEQGGRVNRDNDAPCFVSVDCTGNDCSFSSSVGGDNPTEGKLTFSANRRSAVVTFPEEPKCCLVMKADGNGDITTEKIGKCSLECY